MKTQRYLLAIDQGTTNSRAIIFDREGNNISQHELALTQYYPQPGWVEQDPLEMLSHTIICCRTALQKAQLVGEDIAALGISNQRETTILWDKQTGLPIYPAIVWQDRRTAELCRQLAQSTIADVLQRKTGLFLDPYFSATKILWLLDNIRDARSRAERGEILFGTVDTFLLWKLTQGKSHATDVTNASRTLLFNIETQTWDEEILAALRIPKQLLPSVHDNTADFGVLDASILNAPIPITGIAGDQQAATIGQACFQSGMVKATYGTGGFLLLNTGAKRVHSQQQLLTTVVYRINKQMVYGLEGSIFSTGTTVKWLRDSLRLIQAADETETCARRIASTQGVYLVPAFTGLGAPYWDPQVRAAIIGILSTTSRDEIVRAALESVAYQTRDLLAAMVAEGGFPFTTLRVDGGMTVNTWLLQFLADMLDCEVERPRCVETTALGAAYLAGLQVGMYQSLNEISALWQMSTRYSPHMSAEPRDFLYQGWKKAVASVVKKTD